jgi:glycosyltransferase involved in cell wall biosynthesis
MFYKKYAMLLTFIIKNSDIFITVSERNKGLLCKYVDNKYISKIVVVPNGYDNNLFQPRSKEKARSELGISEKSIVIVNIANLLPHKGHKDLIKAIELLKTNYKIQNIDKYQRS